MEGSSVHPKPKKQLSKKRLELDKRVVKKVKVEAKADPKLKSDQFPPSDSWSWRKYGQKPIKGSPYPRGYYKCTTSKGCLAKKTVEKSKDDASMVIITYTTDHNHPGPDIQSPCNQAQKPIKAQPTSSGLGQPSTKTVDHEEEKAYVVTLEKNWSEVTMSLSSAGGENEFFNELGELPSTSASASEASSSFTSFMRNYFFDELMLVPHPLSNQLNPSFL